MGVTWGPLNLGLVSEVRPVLLGVGPELAGSDLTLVVSTRLHCREMSVRQLMSEGAVSV